MTTKPQYVHNSIWYDGIRAYLQQEGRDTCPYETTTANGIDWHDGWDEAHFYGGYGFHEAHKTVDELTSQIHKQIDHLDAEQQRVKMFINGSGFDVTTAPYVIAKQYRDALKAHIKLLKGNL